MHFVEYFHGNETSEEQLSDDGDVLVSSYKGLLLSHVHMSLSRGKIIPYPDISSLMFQLIRAG